MKQGRTEKAVFAKLSTHKVELNILRFLDASIGTLNAMNRDQNSVIDKLEQHRKEFMSKRNDVDIFRKNYKEVIDGHKRLMSSVEQQAKELGVNVSDIEKYKSAISALQDAENDIKNLQSILNRYK